MASASRSTTLTANTGAPYSNATLTASFTENSTSTSGNTSNITVTATQKIGNADWSSSYTSTLQIYWYDDKNNSGGQLVKTTGVTSQGRNATITATGTITVAHHTNGSLSGYAKAVWTKGGSSAWTPNSGSVSTANTALTNIPRYPTSNQSLNTKTETSITMNWSSDSTCDYVWYSINGGSSWTAVGSTNATSGSYTISGLAAGTTYSIVTRVRRKTSQLTKDSAALSVATYAYPYANSMPNFTIGDTLTVGIYNPMNRTFSITVIGADNSELYSGDYSGTSVSGFTASGYLNFWYASIPNSQSGTYKVKITYNGNSTTTTGGTYSVNPAICAPSIGSLSYTDVNSTVTAITGNNQNIVQNQSTVRYTAANLAAQNSATISSVSVSVNGNSYNLTISGTSATGGNATIDSSSNVVATATVTDSRGLTATKTVAINMLEWSLPTAIITMQRQSNFYSETDITVDADYSSVDSKNTITIQVRSKKTTSSSYSSWTALSDNVMSTLTLDNNYAWDVQVKLTDAFGGTTTYNLSLSRGMPIIFYDRILSSTGFNCFPVDEQSVEINGVNAVRSVMTRYLTADITNLTANSYVKINLNGSNSFGDKLTTTSDGGIKIGAGVSQILVSGRMLVSCSVIGTQYIRICKNDASSSANMLGWVSHTNTTTSAAFETINVTPALVNVQENDVIYMYYYVPDSSGAIYGNNYGNQTSLTVETIG